MRKIKKTDGIGSIFNPDGDILRKSESGLLDLVIF